MSFLNLTLGQFLTLFAAAGGIAFVLYLLDRSRRKIVVPSLRFWTAAEHPTTVVRRKTVSQPWSLVLQLVGILFLLLAIAQLRFGILSGTPRDHIILLDTSAWMNASAANLKLAGNSANAPARTLMDLARRQAGLYVRNLPGADRVMLVRADALATPATPFLSDKFTVLRAIADTKPASTALDLGQAMSFASRTLQLSARRAGEIVYVGPARIAETDQAIAPVPNLRVLAVPDGIANSGIRHVGLRRSPDDSGTWDVFVSCRNYSSQPRMGTVGIGFGGAPAGAQRVTLEPNADHETAFKLRTHAAGLVEVRLFPTDDFPDDNRAVLEIPAYSSLGVTIYSDTPDLLRPLFSVTSRINAVFKPTGQYQANTPGLVILDHFIPHDRPQGDSLWLDPPPGGFPIPVRARIDHPGPIQWANDQPIAAGLRTKDARPDAVTVFEPAPGDLRVAEIDKGPVIIARSESAKRMVVVGFHPSNPGVRYELATPLLIGNILRWLAPESFRNVDVSASSAGTINMELAAETSPDDIRVVRQDGQPLPFSVTGRSLHFFSGTPGIVRVLAGSHESVYSLSLPGMWTKKWDLPAHVKRGLPAFRETLENPRDLWQFLAALGAAAFLLEWILFGRMNRLLLRPMGTARPASPRKSVRERVEAYFEEQVKGGGR